MTVLAAVVGPWLLGFVIVVVLAILISWWLKRRRSNVWNDLARRHGLTFSELAQGPHVTGQLSGRAIEVATDRTSSDQDVGGVAVVTMSVGLGDVPANMTAEGTPGLMGDLATRLEDRVSFASEDFDRHVIVRGDDLSAIRAYWNPERQQAFLTIIEQACCDQMLIRNSALIAELRDIISDENQLEQLLSRLLVTAALLDSAGPLQED